MKRLLKISTHQFTVVMLAVAAVLYIVQIIACFLTKEAQALCTGHVELLFATLGKEIKNNVSHISKFTAI